MRTVVAASAVGTTIEWYDFLIYGTAASIVLNKLFFPTVNPLAGTLLSIATVGVGFFARPIGAIILSHFGDRLGRKSMLILTLVSMGVATTIVVPKVSRIWRMRRSKLRAVIGSRPAECAPFSLL